MAGIRTDQLWAAPRQWRMAMLSGNNASILWGYLVSNAKSKRDQLNDLLHRLTTHVDVHSNLKNTLSAIKVLACRFTLRFGVLEHTTIWQAMTIPAVIVLKPPARSATI